MAGTSTALFRSVTSDAFPAGVVKDGAAANGVPYPDFYERTLPDGRLREPDVVVFRDTNLARNALVRSLAAAKTI
jgi:hypothetical protein